MSWWRRTWGITLVSVSWRSLAFRWRAVCYNDTWESHHYIDCTAAINKSLGRVLRVTFTYFLLVWYKNKRTKIHKHNFTKHYIERLWYLRTRQVYLYTVRYIYEYMVQCGVPIVCIFIFDTKHEVAKNRSYTHINIVGWIRELINEHTMGYTFMIVLLITKNFGEFTYRYFSSRPRYLTSRHRTEITSLALNNRYNPWTIYQTCKNVIMCIIRILCIYCD